MEKDIFDTIYNLRIQGIKSQVKHLSIVMMANPKKTEEAFAEAYANAIIRKALEER